MEINLSITRILLLAALLAAFAMLGGFSPPSTPSDSLLDPHKVAKAWIYCILLFLSGAVCTSIVDHFVGLMDRSNIRLVYIILGIALMVSSVIWLRSLRGAADDKPTQANTIEAIPFQ
jgi:hypothetical protein